MKILIKQRPRHRSRRRNATPSPTWRSPPAASCAIGGTPAGFTPARARRLGLRRRARAGRPGGAPARAGPRTRGHAGKRDARGHRRRRHQPGVPTRHRPGARRARPGRHAEDPRREAAPGARVPAGRAHARPGRRGADRDGRAHRVRLRRLQQAEVQLANTQVLQRACSTRPPTATPCGCARRSCTWARAWPPAVRWPRAWVSPAFPSSPRPSRCTPSWSWRAPPAPACTCAA
jgi:hypothetical protein